MEEWVLKVSIEENTSVCHLFVELLDELGSTGRRPDINLPVQEADTVSGGHRNNGNYKVCRTYC